MQNDGANPRIIAIANQKGGVGKTTTAINLGTALAALGNRVLLVDFDPQGNASTGLGVASQDRIFTAYDLIFAKKDTKINVCSTTVPGLDIIPATPDLSSADVQLVPDARRLHKIRDLFENGPQNVVENDFILIDCPPSLNLLTLNAFVAADSVLVPLQCEFFALEGLSQLMRTVQSIRSSSNRNLVIEGVVLTMFDRRNNLSSQVAEDARSNLGTLVFDTIIPRNVRLSEAPSHAIPALVYDHTSAGSIAYQKLAGELLARIRKNSVTEEIA